MYSIILLLYYYTLLFDIYHQTRHYFIFFSEFLSEDGRKRLKHLGGLLLCFILLLYLIIMKVEHIYMMAYICIYI